MVESPSTLEDAFKALATTRKGVDSPSLGTSLHVDLRQAWGIAEGDTPRTVRQKVVQGLEELIDELTNEDAIIAKVSYGVGNLVPPEFSAPREKRFEWFNSKAGREATGIEPLSLSHTRSHRIPGIVKIFARLIEQRQAGVVFDNHDLKGKTSRTKVVEDRSSIRRAQEEAAFEDLVATGSVEERSPTHDDVGNAESSRTSPRHALDYAEPTPYVARPLFHARFDESVEAGRRIVALVGEPGNGKSRLAREILREKLVDGGTVVYIRGDQLPSDLAGSLAAHERPPQSFEITELKSAFVSLVCSKQAPVPDYVLLDGMEEKLALIEELVPPGTLSTVLITSRETISLRGRSVAIIAVKEMKFGEASDLVCKLRPQTTSGECGRLVEAVGARPLPIVQACGFVGDGLSYSISDFCDDIERDAAAALWHVSRPVEWTMTWIYKRLLDSLKDSSDATELLAYHVLMLIAFLGRFPMTPDLLRRAVQLSAEVDIENKDLPRQFNAATSLLRGKYIVDTDDADFITHSLTQQLLRGLFIPQRVEACLVLHRAIRERLQHLLDAPFMPKTERWVFDVFHAAAILNGFGGWLKFSTAVSERVYSTYAAVRQCDYSSGDTSISWAALGDFQPDFLVCSIPELQTSLPDASYEDLLAYVVATCGVLSIDYRAGRLSPYSYLKVRETLDVTASQVLSVEDSIRLDALFLEATVGIGDADYFHASVANYGVISNDTAAWLEMLSGEILVRQGYADEAVSKLASAWDKYRELKPGIDRLRGSARVVRDLAMAATIGNAFLRRDDGEDAILEMVREVQDELALANWETLTEGFLCHAVATGLAMRCVNFADASGAPVDLSSNFSNNMNAAVNRYMDAGYVREVADLRYDALMVWGRSQYRVKKGSLAPSTEHKYFGEDLNKYSAIFLVEQSEEISFPTLVQEHVREVDSHCDQFGACRLALCDAKWRLTRDALSLGQIDWLERVAISIVDYYNSEYWYREALICASVASWRISRNVASLVDQIRISSASLRSMRRFELLSECLALDTKDGRVEELLAELLFSY
jgi:hypothetical protein